MKLPKLPKVPHVKFTRSKGKIYAYFNAGKKDGKIVWVALPPWGSLGFFDTYNALMGHRTRRAAVLMTSRQLIGVIEELERRAGKWQGIESAPKDGTYVLLAGKDWTVEARWSEYGEAFYELNNDPTDAWGGPVDEATAWMPLPSPPDDGQ